MHVAPRTSSGRPGRLARRIRFCLVAAPLLLGAEVTRAQATQPFETWLAELRREAIETGISETTVDSALTGIEPIERVVELDRNQPEFRLEFRDYLNRVVSEQRIEQGRRMLEEHRELLADITRRYGIPARFLVAAWGIESNFGRTQGSFSVINALVTLAYDDRRAAFFRGELLDALRILDQGHITLQAMQGSWAGAMGQLQFMPSTFVGYARDSDGDGRKDIWQSTPDALESAANFMASLGWQRGYTWGRQVRLPEGFDPELADLDVTRSLPEWQAAGVRSADGSALPQVDIEASIVWLTEYDGPAFVVYNNYRVIRRWNRSHLFAVAFGHLADRLDGRPPLELPP